MFLVAMDAYRQEGSKLITCPSKEQENAIRERMKVWQHHVLRISRLVEKERQSNEVNPLGFYDIIIRQLVGFPKMQAA
jgi:hypothetical protein